MVQIRYTGKGKCSYCKKLLRNGERIELHINSTGTLKAAHWECLEEQSYLETELDKGNKE